MWVGPFYHRETYPEERRGEREGKELDSDLHTTFIAWRGIINEKGNTQDSNWKLQISSKTGQNWNRNKIWNYQDFCICTFYFLKLRQNLSADNSLLWFSFNSLVCIPFLWIACSEQFQWQQFACSTRCLFISISLVRITFKCLKENRLFLYWNKI